MHASVQVFLVRFLHIRHVHLHVALFFREHIWQIPYCWWWGDINSSVWRMGTGRNKNNAYNPNNFHCLVFIEIKFITVTIHLFFRITASGWKTSVCEWGTHTSSCTPWQTNPALKRLQSYGFSCAELGSQRTSPSSWLETKVTWCAPEKCRWMVRFQIFNLKKC